MGAESDGVTFWSVVPSFSGETLPAQPKGDTVTRIRIYSHTTQDAPEASRPLLEGLVQFSPTRKLRPARFPTTGQLSSNERGTN